MPISANTAYLCAITWHDAPTDVEHMQIFAGELPDSYRYTAIDEQIFFELPVADLYVGYDAGDWCIVDIIAASWYLR
jgi:hypothetical protein